MFFFFPLRDEYRVKRFPLIVLSLITLNVIIFFAYAFRPEYRDIVIRHGFIPSDFSFSSLFSSMFLHGGITHLGFNMWFLWLFGNNLEDRWNRFPFLMFYLAAGVFSMLLYSVLIPQKLASIPTIGASGAIAGVLGAYAILFPKSRITFKYFIWVLIFIIRFGEFKLYAWIWLALWFAQQGFLTLLVARGVTASSVAFGAHFAGFLFGAVIGTGTKIYRETQFKKNVHLGENVLLNLLGRKKHFNRTFEELSEIENRKNLIISLLETDKLMAAKHYEELAEKYPETVLPQKAQFKLAETLMNLKRIDSAFIAYKNFVLNYTFSKLADRALLDIGKILIEKDDLQKAKYAFLQIVLFYPYSEVYEEAKYFLEKKLPRMSFEKEF